MPASFDPLPQPRKPTEPDPNDFLTNLGLLGQMFNPLAEPPTTLPRFGTPSLPPTPASPDLAALLSSLSRPAVSQAQRPAKSPLLPQIASSMGQAALGGFDPQRPGPFPSAWTPLPALPDLGTLLSLLAQGQAGGFDPQHPGALPSAGPLSGLLGAQESPLTGVRAAAPTDITSSPAALAPTSAQAPTGAALAAVPRDISELLPPTTPAAQKPPPTTAPGAPGAPAAAGGLQGAIAAAIAADTEIQKRLAAIEEAKQALTADEQKLRRALAVAEATGEYEGKPTLIAELRKRLVVVEEKLADLEAERIRGIIATTNRSLNIQEEQGRRANLRDVAKIMGYVPADIFQP